MFIARIGAAALVLTVLGQPTPAPPLGQPTPARRSASRCRHAPRRRRPRRPRRRNSGRQPAPTSCAANTALPRQQRPALLPPRRPRRSGQEIHQRQEHDPLPDAARTTRRIQIDLLRQPQRRQDPARRRRRSSTTRELNARLHRLPADAQGGPRRTRSTSTTPAAPNGAAARFGGIAFRKDPAGKRLDQHRLRRRRREHLVAEQGSVARRSREAWTSASRSPTA